MGICVCVCTISEISSLSQVCSEHLSLLWIFFRLKLQTFSSFLGFSGDQPPSQNPPRVTSLEQEMLLVSCQWSSEKACKEDRTSYKILAWDDLAGKKQGQSYPLGSLDCLLLQLSWSATLHVSLASWFIVSTGQDSCPGHLWVPLVILWSFQGVSWIVGKLAAHLCLRPRPLPSCMAGGWALFFLLLLRLPQIVTAYLGSLGSSPPEKPRFFFSVSQDSIKAPVFLGAR